MNFSGVIKKSESNCIPFPNLTKLRKRKTTKTGQTLKNLNWNCNDKDAKAMKN